MAEDDRKNTHEDVDDTPQISVPSHDPLPLPPEVNYTRPNSVNQGSTTPRNEYGSPPSKSPVTSTDASGAVKYSAGLAGGVSLASTILGGYWLGSKIDEHFHLQTPWATIAGILLGSFGGFWNMFRLLKRAERLDQNNK